MTHEHRLAIEIMSECGMSRVAIIKDAGWYLDEAPTMYEVRQVLTKRRNNSRILTMNGKTLDVDGWAQQTGIKSKTIYERLRLGWSVEDALTKPVKPTHPIRRLA